MYRLVISVIALNGMNELGGHYFSALVTARELAKKHKVGILVIGDFIPVTLAVDDIEVRLVKYKPKIFQVCPKEVQASLMEFNPDIIIAFDPKSGSMLRIVSVREKLGFVQVTPGGAIKKILLQNNPHQVHFSKKDYDSGLKRVRYKNKVISWIPNRVANEDCDWGAIEILKNNLKIAEDELVLIRIGRVHEKYKRAFISAINAANIIRSAGFKTRLIMIGSVTHQDVADHLNLLKSEYDVLLTETQYTNSAKRFLGVAHINLGVGRGFMEGCASGNFMLAMAGESNIPVVVTEKIFHSLFFNNFSLRSKSEIPESLRISEIIELARAAALKKLSQQSIAWFKEYFDSSKLVDLYQPVLDAANRNRENLDLNVMKNGIVFLAKEIVDKIR